MNHKKYLYNGTADPNHAALKLISLIDNGQQVLEIGCASGVMTKYLKEDLSCRVTGVEIDPLAGEDARPYCENLIIGNIEELELHEILGEQSFDAIIFADVLEHLYHPVKALQKVSSFLKKDGCLIASIPNIAHAAICWELAHGRFDYQEFGLLDNTHIRFFTKKNIARLFEEAGYRITYWDRITLAPEKTEFNIHFGSARDQSFMDWILKNNPEANTYQFIIKAQHIDENSHESRYQNLEARDTIKKLEAQVSELSRQKLKLESEVAWLEKNRFGRMSWLMNRLRNKN